MRSSRITARRLKLLQASLKIFAKKGFHQTAVSDIADASKIGHGTFYGYFTSKTAIFRALVEHVHTRILGVLVEDAFDRSRTLEDYRGQLIRIGDRLFELFRKEPELAQIVFYESWIAGEEVAKLSEQTFDLLNQATKKYLDHGLAQGYLRPDFDTATAAAAINMMLFESMKSVLKSDEAETEFAKWKKLIPLMIIEGLANKT